MPRSASGQPIYGVSIYNEIVGAYRCDVLARLEDDPKDSLFERC